MIQNADIIFYQCIHDSPKTGYVGPPPGPPSFDSPVFGNGRKTNRVARGHHGLPVSSKAPPLPQRRQPLRERRGIPISLASAAPQAAQPGLSSRAPEVLEGEPAEAGIAELLPEKARYPATRARDLGPPASASLASAPADGPVAFRGREALSRGAGREDE